MLCVYWKILSDIQCNKNSCHFLQFSMEFIWIFPDNLKLIRSTFSFYHTQVQLSVLEKALQNHDTLSERNY